jgi:hypothetical protein
MDNLLVNWKTSAAGAAAVVGAIGDVLTQVSTGHWDGSRLIADWTAISAGVGLLFAKDASVPSAPAAQAFVSPPPPKRSRK